MMLLVINDHILLYVCIVCFFFQAEDGIRDLTVTGVQTCALPIFPTRRLRPRSTQDTDRMQKVMLTGLSPSMMQLSRSFSFAFTFTFQSYNPSIALTIDRKSTRLNSSHSQISYAVFCLKKKQDRTDSSDQITAHERAIGERMIGEMTTGAGTIGERMIVQRALGRRSSRLCGAECDAPVL